MKHEVKQTLNALNLSLSCHLSQWQWVCRGLTAGTEALLLFYWSATKVRKCTLPCCRDCKTIFTHWSLPSMVTFDKQNVIFFHPLPSISKIMGTLTHCHPVKATIGRKLPQITGFWHYVYQKPCILLNCPFLKLLWKTPAKCLKMELVALHLSCGQGQHAWQRIAESSHLHHIQSIYSIDWWICVHCCPGNCQQLWKVCRSKANSGWKDSMIKHFQWKTL